ncbi:MAG: vWA domain-containing protein [Armatimonadota bacterium]
MRRIAVIPLFALLVSVAVTYAQPQTTIGPVPDEMQQNPGIEPWMLSDDVKFHREGWWLGGYSNTMMVEWGPMDVKVGDLTEAQKTYLWEKLTHEQRKQMSDEYGKIGFGMGGYLKQRPEEWGSVLNARIAEYWRGVHGWTEVRKQAQKKNTPPQVFEFLDDKDAFIQANGDKLTPEQISKIEDGAEQIKNLGQLIAVLRLKRVEIAVKGISGGLIGIITDYCTGFATHGAHYVSDAVATVVSKIIDLGKNASNKSLSPGEQIELLNARVEEAVGVLDAEIAKQRKMWADMIGEEPPEDEDSPASGPVELSILFLVDCSGSMDGSKIDSARKAVVQSVASSNDGKTEWALLGFGGSCSCWQVVPFTTDASAVQSAAQGLSAGGGTPLTYSMYKALAYLTKNGSGSVGRLVILCDGQNNCGEREGGGTAEAAAGLRTIIKIRNLAPSTATP